MNKDAEYEAKQEVQAIKQDMNKKYDEFAQGRMQDQEDLKKYEDIAIQDIKQIRGQFAQNKD